MVPNTSPNPQSAAKLCKKTSPQLAPPLEQMIFLGVCVLVNAPIDCHSSHYLQARLCRWMLHARDATGSPTLVLTQQFLSEILGAQRTTVNLERASCMRGKFEAIAWNSLQS